MSSYFLALLTGGVLGALFAILKLPIPAPISLQGVVGISGITIGYLIVNKLII